MTPKPEKPPAQAEQSPATGGELTWIAVFLAICLMANSWVVGLGADKAAATAPAPASADKPASAPSAAPERPSRNRPARSERPWRDPAMASLPSF